MKQFSNETLNETSEAIRNKQGCNIAGIVQIPEVPSLLKKLTIT